MIEIVAKISDGEPAIIIDDQVEETEEAVAITLRLAAEINKRVKDHISARLLNSIIDDMPKEEARKLRLQMLQNPKVKELMMESLWALLEAQFS